MCRLDGKCIPKDQRCNKLVELSVSNTNLKGANALSPVPVNQKYGFTEGTSGPKPGSENVSQPDPDPDHSKESACFPLPVSGVSQTPDLNLDCGFGVIVLIINPSACPPCQFKGCHSRVY
jgi:hypothetical protein